MNRNPFSASRAASRRGFTLIELLTVVAIIGLLATILIPAVGSAKTTAKKAKSRSLFNGISVALVNYYSDYGYYPPIANLTNSSPLASTAGADSGSRDLVVALSGRELTGGGGGNLNTLNPRRSPYYSFAESEFFTNTNGAVVDGILADGFNNPAIRIRVDGDGSGKITTSSVTGLPANHGLGAEYRGKVMVWTQADASLGSPDVMSWN